MSFKIAIATDNHLGYQEKDFIRKNDSFLALEEVFEKTLNLDCDFLLLGGDLFHEHNPSKYSLNRALKLFDKFVIGDREIKFETITNNIKFNYLNPALKIKIPVFIIHGNHDDPSSDTNVSAINIMESANYLNYIICHHEEEKINVKPIILKKGSTLLAIYGIGNAKEERLNRMLKSNNVIFELPENEAKCFCILVIHQNRFKGRGLGPSAKNCIMDWAFPSFIDLIIWGHEHDSYTQPRMAENREYYIYQPGSTVATSLTEGEARIKNMLLLEIKNIGFKMTAVPLENTRPILYKQLELNSICNNTRNPEQIITNIFNDMISETNNIQKLFPPLVRIKIEISDFETFRPFYLNSKFSEKTANKDVITVWKRNITENKEKETEIKTNTITDDIIKILSSSLAKSNTSFQISCPEQFIESVADVAIKKDNKAIENYFNTKLEMACETIRENCDVFNEPFLKKKIEELDISYFAPTYKRSNQNIKLMKTLKK